MTTRSSLNRAASALALAGMLTACASSGGNRTASVSDYRVKSVDVGMATRALAALNANDFAQAIIFAEKAVAQSPRDAGFRALLGNAYFGAGRFASAEQAYRDSLSLYANQPQVMLKLALVEISLGRLAEARELIDYARDRLDPADYGLALALAGRAGEAVEVLRQAAGSPASDPRVRQNLALAHALAGDWVNARVVAAQDVAPNELDLRIRQWMEFASPAARPETRVATLTGVKPMLGDPGQPVQLALAAPLERGTAVASADVAPAPAPAPGPVVTASEVAFAPPPPPPYYAPAEPAVVAASAAIEPAPQASSITVKLPEARPVPVAAPAIAAAAPAEMAPPALRPAEFPYVEVKKRAPVRKASAPAKPRPPLRQAALKTGKSGVVVQLGAYGSSQAVMTAWNAKARKFAALANYLPVSARFSGPKGNFYRLSVRGFASPAEAARLCGSIKKSGGACFVRSAAGDRPVQIASR